MHTNAKQADETKRAPQGHKHHDAEHHDAQHHDAQHHDAEHHGAKHRDAKKTRVLKLGIDVHWNQYTVVAQHDDASPRPPRQFTPEQFIEWAAQQRDEAREVRSCYEAGAFGYVLHRKLTALGVRNVVVRPRNWDEYGAKVKTDQRDALSLCGMLDRHLAGNTGALCVIRVPTEPEEQSRGQTRQRDSLVADRARLGNRALGAARYYGHDLPQRWWRPRALKRLEEQLPAHLRQTLGRWHKILLALDTQIDELGGQIETARPEKLPTGPGALTAEIIDREAGDWNRFKNRRQVGSHTGLIPSENSSGQGRKQGPITKHGNPRLRKQLIETVWRLLQYQPDYRPIKRLRPALQEARLRGQSARRRKLIVAIARQLAIDWWRLRTARAKPEQLGLQMSWPSAAVLKAKNPAQPTRPQTTPAQQEGARA